MTEADHELEHVTTDQTGGGSSAPVPSGANKFWEVELDYAFDETRTINSYLRLGTFEQNPALQTEDQVPIPASSASTIQNANFHRGHDLAAMIVDFYDDTRDRGVVADAPDPRDPFFTDPAERQAESALLHTKGGWRDHSDGNRVSTTRGDKIEVIRGNYQMVVLGRQDQLANQSRYEAGGGHFSRDNDNLTPGAIFKISWVRDKFNGTWKVVEETTKGDYRIRYHGNVEEAFFGDHITTTIGSEDDETEIDDWQSPQDVNVRTTNPTILERTYAESITIERGSNQRPIQTVLDTSDVVNLLQTSYSRERTIKKNYSEGDVKLASFTSGTVAEERRGKYVGRFDGLSREYWGTQFGRPDDVPPEGFEHSTHANNFFEVFGRTSQSIKFGAFMETRSFLSLGIMAGLQVDTTCGQAVELGIGMNQEYAFITTRQWWDERRQAAIDAGKGLYERGQALLSLWE